MSKKTVDNYKRTRRTGKIIETLEQKQKRHDDFLRRLDEAADRVLSGRSTVTAPTEDELKEMRRQKPEVGEVLDALFDVADKLKK
jgi:hypothetical protein